MRVDPSTRRHLEDHLGQAEFALRVAANFDCLKGTPAHGSVRAALARVAEARGWIRESLPQERPVQRPLEPACQSAAERRRIVHRRMARMCP